MLSFIDNSVIMVQMAIEDRLLRHGFFLNITTGQTGPRATALGKLQPVIDTTYSEANGYIWQSYFRPWVWESGITMDTGTFTTWSAPTVATGVFVNNGYIEKDHATSGYIIDYLNGRVIFHSPIATGSNVRANYAAKVLTVTTAEGDRALYDESYWRNKEPVFSTPNTPTSNEGDTILLPALLLQWNQNKQQGLQIGHGRRDFLTIDMFLIAENNGQRQSVAGIVQDLQFTTLPIPDFNKGDLLPLDAMGDRKSNALTFAQIQASGEHNGYIDEISWTTVPDFQRQVHRSNGRLSLIVERE